MMLLGHRHFVQHESRCPSEKGANLILKEFYHLPQPSLTIVCLHRSFALSLSDLFNGCARNACVERPTGDKSNGAASNQIESLEPGSSLLPSLLE